MDNIKSKQYLQMKATYIFVPILFLTLNSCEEVINVNLNESSPQIVIEGNVSNLGDTVKVIVSETTNFFNPIFNTAITGANVSISDDHGNNFNLTEYFPGKYGSVFAGIPGYNYKLSVKTNTGDFSALSIMPVPVTIDSLWINQQTLGRNKTDVINCLIRDPVNISNYYCIQVYRNDTLLNNGSRVLLYTDKYFDGNYNTFVISARRLGVGQYFTKNDTLRFLLLSIDNPTYEYFKELRSIIDHSILSASTPANPANNITPKGLGYFSARSITEKTIIVK